MQDAKVHYRPQVKHLLSIKPCYLTGFFNNYHQCEVVDLVSHGETEMYNLHVQFIAETLSLTLSLTPWNRVLLDNLIVTHLVKKFPAFYGTRRFTTVFTTAHDWSLF